MDFELLFGLPAVVLAGIVLWVWFKRECVAEKRKAMQALLDAFGRAQ